MKDHCPPGFWRDSESLNPKVGRKAVNVSIQGRLQVHVGLGTQRNPQEVSGSWWGWEGGKERGGGRNKIKVKPFFFDQHNKAKGCSWEEYTILRWQKSVSKSRKQMLQPRGPGESGEQARLTPPPSRGLGSRWQQLGQTLIKEWNTS